MAVFARVCSASVATNVSVRQASKVLDARMPWTLACRIHVTMVTARVESSPGTTSVFVILALLGQLVTLPLTIVWAISARMMPCVLVPSSAINVSVCLATLDSIAAWLLISVRAHHAIMGALVIVSVSTSTTAAVCQVTEYYYFYLKERRGAPKL